MELTCTVQHQPDCKYGQIPTSTNTSSVKCTCGAEDTIAFIKYQSMMLKAKDKENQRLRDALMKSCLCYLHKPPKKCSACTALEGEV